MRSTLDAQVKAISGYDDILWKIRTGYLVILYGAIALFINKDTGLDIKAMTGNFLLFFTIFLLVSGFSFACFMVDFGYLRKKLKVIVARDLLMDIALGHQAEQDNRLKHLLHIAGETQIGSLPDPLKTQFKSTYHKVMYWNLRWILVVLYGTTPLLVLLIYFGAIIFGLSIEKLP